MIRRALEADLRLALTENAAVVLLGPRQVGKTTLARSLETVLPSRYLDLQSERDRALVTDAASFIERHSSELLIFDEIHQRPNLFSVLRGSIDEERRQGQALGRFLLLGSAALDLMRQSGETLAGRVAYLELGPLNASEIKADTVDALWLRGGFPRSFTARDNAASRRWRRNFVRSYLEREIPELGPRIPAETLRRLWVMLAHHQGSMLQATKLATSLGTSTPTVLRYIDLLVDLLLVRRLAPWHANVGKRLVKSPKIFIRDSGIVHDLLGISHLDMLLSHPVAGMSWEGFVIETLIASAGSDVTPYFYRTANGAEIDLLLHYPDDELWVIEIKRSDAPTLQRGYLIAIDDLQPHRRFVVYGGSNRFPLRNDIEAISLRELATLVRRIGGD